MFFSAMEMTSCASNPSRFDGLLYTPFTFDIYVCEYESFSGTNWLAEEQSNGDAEAIYDSPSGLDRNTVLGVGSLRWAQ